MGLTEQHFTKILTKSKFEQHVKKLIDTNTNVLDACLHVCERNGIPPEDVSKYMSKSLKEEVREHAITINAVKTS